MPADRVSKIEADMLDVPSNEHSDPLHRRVLTTVLITEITLT